MKGIILSTRLLSQAKAQEESSGRTTKHAPLWAEQSKTLEWSAWFEEEGISLGPVWKSGSRLLAWDGSLGAGRASSLPEGPKERIQDVRALLYGLGSKGWRFLEGAWGPFRLVWVDLLAGKWIMARAPQGLKPLFWLETPEGVFFAEEIPSLLELMPFHPEPDWRRIPEYMVFQHVAAGNTLYKGVRELLPGEVILGNLASHKTRSQSLWPGWLKSHRKDPSSSIPEPKEVLWRALRKSLAREPELRSALFLSGGVDSALLAWGLRESEASIDLRCFTLTCPGYHYDEHPFALRVARELELQWEPIELNPTIFSRAWEEAVATMGLPLTSTNQVVWWILSKAASASGVQRVFSGEGADGWLSGGLYQEEREALLLAGSDLGKSSQVVISCKAHTLNEPLLVRRVLNQPLDLKPRRNLWLNCIRSLSQEPPMERAVFYHVRTVGNRLLTRADLAARVHGLIVELPFLEECFLLWSRAMGWEKRNPEGLNKEPLKSLCCSRFGVELAYRKKIGFPFPIRTWIRDSPDNRLENFREMLLEERTLSRPIYSRVHLEKEVKARLDGTARPADWLLWSLINLELWLRWLEEHRSRPYSPDCSPLISPASPAVP